MVTISPEILQGVIITVSASVVTTASGYVVYKLRQVGTNTITIQGVDGVEELDGLLGSVEMLNREVDGNSQDIDEIQDEMEKIRKKLSRFIQMVNEVDQAVEDNRDEITEVQDRMKDFRYRIKALERDIGDRNDGN